MAATSHKSNHHSHPVARFVTTRWISGLIAALFLLGGGALIGMVGTADQPDTALAGLALGSDSREAAELQAALPEDDSATAVVLFASKDKLTSEQLGFINQRAPELIGKAAGPPVVPSKDGTAAIAIVPMKYADASAARDQVKELRKDARADAPDGLSVQVTGPAAVTADLASVFDGANVRLLIATGSVVALLLIITYRSPVLWLIPLSIVAVADQVAGVAATHVLNATGVLWDESTSGILSVLVFGAATDYALLLISRYRDELRTTHDRRAAMATALTRTAEAVISSATTVVLGLLTLLLSLFPTTRGLGLACAVGVIVAALTILIVLPAALVVFGRWIFWPQVPHEGTASLADSRSLWRRIGDFVAARPRGVTVVVLAGLALASLGALRIDSGLAPADQFLDKPEAIAASERLATSFPAGSADPTVVLTRGDGEAVAAAAEKVDGVDSARVGQSAEGVTEVTVVLSKASGTDAATDTVNDLREALSTQSDTYVGGTTAQSIDEASATSRDRLLIFPLVLMLVMIGLGAILRTVVAPIILVATVLATYVASLGIAWLLFTQVFGFERLDAGAPLLAFVFSVALGVDYNIFLVTRAKEEAWGGHGAREGMLRSLAATGGVITSAGILLAAVFAVLGVLPLVVLAQVGAIICVGVLLDTLIVRTMLVPAIALILGDRFWWPRRLPNA